MRVLAAGAALALVASACGGDNGEDGTADTADTDTADTDTDAEATDDEAASGELQPSEGDVELTIWFGREDFQPGDAFESFEEEYPNITVNTDVIPMETAPQDFIRQFQSGNAPDIVQAPFESAAPMFAQDVLMDITPIKEWWEAEDPEGFNDLAPVAWEMGEWQGVPHGLTTTIGSVWFNYRVDWFEEAGIDHPPETYEDVLEAGRQLSDGDRIGFAFPGSRSQAPVSWFLTPYMAMGGEFDDQNAPVLTSEGSVYLLEFLQTLMRDGIADPATLAWDSGDFRAAYLGGRAAMAQIGMNILPELNENLEYGEEWVATAHPVRPGAEDQAQQQSRGWPYYVSADTEHPYEVGLVLRYLADPVNQKEIGLRYQPPASISVNEDPEFLEAQPWVADLDIANMTPLPVHDRQLEIHEVLLDAMQEALQNPDADASEIAARHQEAIDALNE